MGDPRHIGDPEYDTAPAAKRFLMIMASYQFTNKNENRIKPTTKPERRVIGLPPSTQPPANPLHLVERFRCVQGTKGEQTVVR